MSERKAYGYFLIMGIATWVLGAYLTDFTSDWNQVQYHFNYAREFLRRGLVGHVFHLAGITVTNRSVALFSASAHLLTVVACIFVFEKHLRSTDPSVRKAFLLLFAVSPATFMHYGKDIGRYDEVLVLIVIVSILLVQKKRFLIASLLTSAAILIHEIFVVTGVPMLVGYTLSRAEEAREKGESSLPSLAIPVASLVTLLAVLLYGGAEFDQRYAVDPSAVDMLLQRRLVDHLKFTAHEYTNPLVYGRFLICAVYVLPLGLIYRKLFERTQTWQEKALVLSPAAIGPLFIIGVDFERWIAFLVLNALLILAVLGPKRMKREDLFNRKIRFFYCAHLSFALLGPLPSRGPFTLLSLLSEKLM